MEAHATFKIDSWAEEPYDEAEGARLLRGHVAKTFTGDIEGTSTAELLMVHTADGPAAYTAQERFTGSVQGRQGTFVSQHGAAAGPEGELTWIIVTGSGTHQLAGIRGRATLDIHPDGTHVFALDYELS